MVMLVIFKRINGVLSKSVVVFIFVGCGGVNLVVEW